MALPEKPVSSAPPLLQARTASCAPLLRAPRGTHANLKMYGLLMVSIITDDRDNRGVKGGASQRITTRSTTTLESDAGATSCSAPLVIPSMSWRL